METASRDKGRTFRWATAGSARLPHISVMRNVTPVTEHAKHVEFTRVNGPLRCIRTLAVRFHIPNVSLR